MKFSIRLIQTTITALLLSLMPLMAMESKAPEVEMYPDEMPKSKLVFTLDLSENIGKKQKESVMHTDIEKFFNSIGFLKLERSFHFRTPDHPKKDMIFGKFSDLSKEKLEDLVIVERQYYETSVSPSFEKRCGYVEDSVYQKEKWHIPNKRNMHDMREDSAIEMSWKWVDIAIHDMSEYITTESGMYGKGMTYIFFDKMYEKIRSEGLINAFARIAIISNGKKMYTFHSLYNEGNDEEKNKSIEILLKIKEKLL